MSERSVQRWAKQGKLSAVQVGFSKEYQFEREDVIRLAEEVNLELDWSSVEGSEKA